MLKDLCAYPREDRLKAITELEKDAGWPAYPLHVRVQMLHSYLNKKRAHPRARALPSNLAEVLGVPVEDISVIAPDDEEEDEL